MSRRKRVLIVEDDPDLARILTRAFRMRHFEAASVRKCDDALASAGTLPPDYAIVDLRLGAHSGMGLIRPLKAINPAMRILVLTGYASIATAVDSIKLGAAHYMAKPAYIEEIISSLGIDPVALAGEEGAPMPGGKRGFDELEWKLIVGALREHGGNLSAAARALGMYRRTLQRKLAARNDSAGKDLLGEIRKRVPQRRRRSLRPSNKE
ncbi:MAG: response regulator [Betaproteobacteria bacterium]|nr:response regulator [Betaproteobacteria bacterium]